MEAKGERFWRGVLLDELEILPELMFGVTGIETSGEEKREGVELLGVAAASTDELWEELWPLGETLMVEEEVLLLDKEVLLLDDDEVLFCEELLSLG